MAEPDPQKQRVMTYSIDVYVMLTLISLFAYFSLQILSPFISILLWAVILAVAIHPLFDRLRVALGGRAGRASAIVAVIALVIVFVPAFLVVESMIDSLGQWAGVLRRGEVIVPPPDEAVKSWPLVGNRLFEIWQEAYADLTRTVQHFAPHLENVALYMLGAGAGLAGGILQFALSIVFAALFLSFAKPLSVALQQLADRVASERGRSFVEMAGATIRNVSRGILGVAVIQGGLASIGILAAGFPFAGFLSAACVAACIVQVPVLVIVPTIIYAWATDSTTVALIYTLYMIPVMLSDNVLKPILMARGLETPMVVILIGVIGGTLTKGLMGLFIGPVVLALFYKMVINWVAAIPGRTEAPSQDEGTGVRP